MGGCFTRSSRDPPPPYAPVPTEDTKKGSSYELPPDLAGPILTFGFGRTKVAFPAGRLERMTSAVQYDDVVIITLRNESLDETLSKATFTTLNLYGVTLVQLFSLMRENGIPLPEN